MELIRKYFPGLTADQAGQLEKLLKILPELNQRVNVVSRKDIEHLEERHILHSLSIAKKFLFSPSDTVIDAGTGGGFPGIPLAILFPETRFILADSVGKKIRLAGELCRLTGLENVEAFHGRVEQMNSRADFVISRAVTAFPRLYDWTSHLIRPGGDGSSNGLIALKGGDLASELETFLNRVEIYPISEWYQESFFSTKSIVYLKK